MLKKTAFTVEIFKNRKKNNKKIHYHGKDLNLDPEQGK